MVNEDYVLCYTFKNKISEYNIIHKGLASVFS